MRATEKTCAINRKSVPDECARGRGYGAPVVGSIFGIVAVGWRRSQPGEENRERELKTHDDHSTRPRTSRAPESSSSCTRTPEYLPERAVR